MWFKEKRKGNLNKLSIFLLNATWRKNLTLSQSLSLLSRTSSLAHQSIELPVASVLYSVSFISVTAAYP